VTKFANVSNADRLSFIITIKEKKRKMSVVIISLRKKKETNREKKNA
jgi:hypothetical protein